jgi:hypothetical protein
VACRAISKKAQGSRQILPLRESHRGSSEYDEQIQKLEKSAEEIADWLKMRMAAGVLRPVHDETGGLDGYFSTDQSAPGK